jgi:hypothetical protein
MRASLVALAACAVPWALAAQAPPAVLPAVTQIADAVLPLPETMRAGARVLGYAVGRELAELRTGTNGMTCLADDPRDAAFHVACYHDSLEPFMARGRALRAQGLGPEAVDSVRYAEVAAGRIRMPPVASLYSLTGPPGSRDSASGEVRGARRLFVVYIPFATEASTGLSTLPRQDAPWLMFPGTPKAHIMFVPSM